MRGLTNPSKIQVNLLALNGLFILIIYEKPQVSKVKFKTKVESCKYYHNRDFVNI